MTEKIKAAIPDWEYVPSIVAQSVYEDLNDNDPALIVGFLIEQAIPLITKLVIDIKNEDPPAKLTNPRSFFRRLIKTQGD